MSRVPGDPWLGFRICFPLAWSKLLGFNDDWRLDRIRLYSAVLKFLRTSEKPPVSKCNYGGAPVVGKVSQTDRWNKFLEF